MNTLYKELNTLSNQDLVQVFRASVAAISDAAEQILTKRGVYVYDTVDIDERLSEVYIKHLNITFG